MYWYFNHGFKFQKSVCNGCYDLLIIIVKGIDYHCIIHNISKSDAINSLENSILDDRGYIKLINIENKVCNYLVKAKKSRNKIF